VVELAEASAPGPVGAPDRLDLVAAEVPRQLGVLGDEPRERDRQVVAQALLGELGHGRRARGEGALERLAAPQQAVDEPLALLAVLAEQRREVLDRRRLDRDEAVALVHVLHDPDDVTAADDVGGKEVARPARRLGAHGPR
jgi:hypothetical protein